MPIYQYTCEKCGKEFEVIQSWDDKTVCPDCKSKRVKRQIGVPSVHMRYSNMHPRHMRGQRRQRKTK